MGDPCTMCRVGLGIALLSFSLSLSAQIIDPEIHIAKHGHDSMKMGDDGRTPFYSYTERTKSVRIKALEKDIAALPKNEQVLRVCEFMRGGAKATLIEKTGKAVDVSVTNYGHSSSIISCVLKYMHDGKTGTQLVYAKKARDSMYLVFVTE